MLCCDRERRAEAERRAALTRHSTARASLVAWAAEVAARRRRGALLLRAATRSAARRQAAALAAWHAGTMRQRLLRRALQTVATRCLPNPEPKPCCAAACALQRPGDHLNLV